MFTRVWSAFTRIPNKVIASFAAGSLVALAVLLGGSAVLRAQSPDAAMGGEVTDEQGRVVPRVTVVLTNLNTGVSRTTQTNDSGVYSLPNLAPGIYRANVTKDGFKSVVKGDIELHVQDNASINFQLQVGSVSETVTVNAGGLAMNTTDASVSTIVDHQFVENMPLNGRSFQDLVTLSPGVSQIPVNLFGGTLGGVGYSGEFVVNGQRTEANYFTVDGVSANTGVAPGQMGGGAGFAGGVPGETVLGSTQSLVSIDALQEFRATTSTYSAEYGRTPGGQFSFRTKSGSNDFHGTAFDYFRNDVMDATNWFNNALDRPKGEERMNDFGGTVGGPFVKDSTFFFFSYEGLRLDSPQPAVRVAVPDLNTRQNAPAPLQAVLNAFPVPNGGSDGLDDGLDYYIQSISYPASLNNVALRIDHNFSANWNVFGRYAYTGSNNTSYQAAVRKLTTGDVNTLTVGSTNIITPSRVNEFRFNYTRNSISEANTSTNLGGAVPIELSSVPGLSSSDAFLFCACYGQESILNLGASPSSQDQINLLDSFHWSIGRHKLSTGIDWRRLATTVTPPGTFAEVYFFEQSSILANTADSALVTARPQVRPLVKNFSAFVQDEWQVLPRLALSLGLRWDINPAPESAGGPSPYTLNQISNLATAELAPAGTPLWKTDWHGFAPRLGVAYQLHSDPRHETLIRAGAGIFYDMGNVLGTGGFAGVGLASASVYSSVPYPLTSSQLQLSPPSVAPPYSSTVWAFSPNLTLPYSIQYSLAIEQRLSTTQSLTLSYVGSGARKLLFQAGYFPGQIGNPNFEPYGFLYVTNNGASSSYNSLQAKYQYTLSHGLQLLASYTYGHSIDNASANSLLSKLLRASSDFDVRHQFQAAVTYDTPEIAASKPVAALANHWGLDLRFQARSSLPLDIGDYDTIVPSTGAEFQYQPDFVPGQPVYLYGKQYPGGKILNYNAFVDAPAGVQGDVPRNFGRAFDAVQADLALRRTFPISERLKLQFRAEAFNLFNHPQFGSVYTLLSDGPGLFGYAYNTLNGQLGGLNPLFQVGGPRSLQLMLRVTF